MKKTDYVCWHGEADERHDETIVTAYDAERAARTFAIQSDEGDDYDIVFVLVEGQIYEFRCPYERTVECRPKRVKTHAVPESDDEAES